MQRNVFEMLLSPYHTVNRSIISNTLQYSTVHRLLLVHCSSHLLGLVSIDLAHCDLNDEPRWYTLRAADGAFDSRLPREVP